MKRIIIDGNIGSGKSTILSLLKDDNFDVISEDVDDWKEYISQFYSDMGKFSLSFQMKVLLHHLNVYNSIKNKESQFILERSPLSCLHIFGENLKEKGLLSELDLNLMKDYNKSFGWYPEYIIYIKTDPKVSYKRISERSRPGENIPLEYLKEIDNLYNKLYIQKNNKDLNLKVLVIDGNKSKEEVYFEVLKEIKKLRN